PEGVLKSGGLSGEQDAAAAGAASQGDLSRSSEAARVLHPETDFPVEEVDGAIEVAPLLGEAVNQAGRDRATAAVDQEIGVTLRGQIVRKDAVDSVGHSGLEDVADGHRVAPAGTVRADRRFPRRLFPFLSEAQLDAARERR